MASRMSSMEIISGRASSAAGEIDGAQPRLVKHCLGDPARTPPSAESAVTRLRRTASRLKWAAEWMFILRGASTSVCSTSTTTGPRSARIFIRTTIGFPPELSCGSSEADPSNSPEGACRTQYMGAPSPRISSTHSKSKLVEEFLNQLLACEIEIGSYVAEDFSESANFELFVSRDCDVVFPAFEVRCDSNVAASLTSNIVAKTAQTSNEFFAAYIACNLQAGIPWSLTKCMRMKRAFCPSSKSPKKPST